jgi:hypothetical protein
MGDSLAMGSTGRGAAALINWVGRNADGIVSQTSRQTRPTQARKLRSWGRGGRREKELVLHMIPTLPDRARALKFQSGI